MTVITTDGRCWPIASPSPLWVVWQPRGAEDGYLAITGDGPCSEGNAALFAGAADIARALVRVRRECDEVRRAARALLDIYDSDQDASDGPDADTAWADLRAVLDCDGVTEVSP